LRPNDSFGGADIKYVSNHKELNIAIEYYKKNRNYRGVLYGNDVIASQYLSDLLLFRGRKMHLRMYYIVSCINGVISISTILDITRNLLSQIFSYILEENKRNEVDELTENVALFYRKEFYENEDKPEYELIKGHSITEVIEIIAHSKVKDYKSLTNKTIFKFMDMIDM
jgi:hypothetical protein